MRKRLLLLVAACSISIAQAQTITAKLTGTITDGTGAVVPDVKVTATHVETGIRYPAQSNEAGVYNLPLLPVGTYTIEIEATGFKKVMTNPVELEVNQAARVDLQLQLGDVTQTIEVEGIVPILQTESAAVSGVISGTTTTALPLNGRAFQQLTLLVPGAIGPDPKVFVNQAPLARPYVNGNREQGNSFLLDGVPLDETIDNRIGYLPNVDSIAQFRIETNNYSAEFGNVTGAVVNTTMKSGTNEFHGNLFEFFRNDALDANSWSNNRNSTPQVKIGKPKLRQSIFGGTVGGPIVQNKIFFFGAYQGTQQRTGGPTATTVAPEEWRRGDLSSIPVPIMDPATGRPFPGNQIPVSRFSPTARALLSNVALYPLPTRPGTKDINGNYATSTVNGLGSYQADGKIDARLSPDDHISGRYSIGNSDQHNLQAPLPTDINGKQFSRPQNIVLNWERAAGPRVVNDARIGLNRSTFVNEPFDWSGIGNVNAKVGIPGGQVIPGLSGIYFGMGVGGSAQVEDNVTNTFQYSDTLSIAQGKHFIKTGGQFLRYQQNRFFSGGSGLLGFFDYDGSFTGAAFSDFLLDQLHRKGIGSRSGTWGHRQNRIGVFIQDDYKAASNLTFNVGMRWEYTSPLVEVKDRQANFDLVTGKELFAGREGNSRALYNAYYRGFEPIVGFAWTPHKFDDKLVVRAGYRITQFMEGTGSGLRLPLNPPFFSEADVSFDRSSGPGTISNGFTDVIAHNQVAGNIRIWNPDVRPQFTQQWNFTLEHQLSNTTSIAAGYVGHKATHLIVPVDFTQPLPGSGDPSTWAPLNQRRPLYRVLPLVGGVSGTDSSGTSDYHALQVQARKRLSGGLEFLGAYTFAKSLTDSMGFFGPSAVASPWNFWSNAYNRRGDRGLSAFDATHSFVWAGTYSLHGWTFSNIVTLHSGFPVTIFQVPTSLQDSRGAERPDRVLGKTGKLENHSPALWLDINAYTPHPVGSFGNAGNGSERAPGYANWDFSVGKQFKISEGPEFELRSEFFNFTNHPSYGPPSNYISDPVSFGRIYDTVSSPRIIEFALKIRY